MTKSASERADEPWPQLVRACICWDLESNERVLYAISNARLISRLSSSEAAVAAKTAGDFASSAMLSAKVWIVVSNKMNTEISIGKCSASDRNLGDCSWF